MIASADSLWEFVQRGFKNEDSFTFYNNLSQNLDECC